MPTLMIRLTRADRVRRGDLLRSRGRTLVVTETIRGADRTVLSTGFFRHFFHLKIRYGMQKISIFST